MIPLQIQKRFANPGKLENDFMNYLSKANLPVQQSKTIATQVLYDAKRVDTFQSIEFFTGNFQQNLTNIEGDFVRPASEHFLIYGIMASFCEFRNGATSGDFPWIKGFTSQGPFNDNQFVPFQNAQVSIEVNSVRYLKYVPTTEWDTETKDKSSGWCYLNTPILWPGQTQLKLTLETNDNSIIFPAQQDSQTFVRFDLYGIGLI